jgi:AcrR family transcriptional regulator
MHDEKDVASRQQLMGAASRRETRQRLLDAASREFEAQGYATATVSRIAARAGVTVQTLYLAWGSKRALLRAYMETTLSNGGHSPGDVLARFAGLPPARMLAELATLFVETAQESATAWKLYRDAAGSDDDIAADWNELQALRRATFRRIVDLIPATAFRAEFNASSATDTVWMVASPESFDLLVRHLTYTPERYLEWLQNTLKAALLRG